MASHRSSRSGLTYLINFLIVSGFLFIIAAGLIAVPVLRDAVLPPPAAFGEEEPDLRPTVTPIPRGNLPAPAVSSFDVTETPQMPVELPETPDLLPGQVLTPIPVITPILTDSAQWIPTQIQIPAIKLDAPIEAVNWSVVRGESIWNIPNHFAAGWLQTSATLGTRSNTVLDGHHNVNGEVFRYLVDLKAGDVITIYSDKRAFAYKVTAMHILPDLNQPIEVRRRNARWIQPTLDERLTLVTCWPYTNNTHRLIVVATPLNLHSLLR
jgi:sortase A